MKNDFIKIYLDGITKAKLKYVKDEDGNGNKGDKIGEEIFEFENTLEIYLHSRISKYTSKY